MNSIEKELHLFLVSAYRVGINKLQRIQNTNYTSVDAVLEDLDEEETFHYSIESFTTMFNNTRKPYSLDDYWLLSLYIPKSQKEKEEVNN